MKCNPLSSETNLSDTSLWPMLWDTYVDNQPVDVYAVGNYFHTYGGRYHMNNLYACPRGEIPSFDNLVPFDGNPVDWGISIHEHTHSGHHDTIDCNCVVTIFRNKKRFYSFTTNDIAYGYARAYTLLTSEIQEGPIDFHTVDFVNKEIRNRHLIYDGKTYTVYHAKEDLSDGILIVPGYIDIKPDDLDCFSSLIKRIDIFSDNLKWI